MTDQTEEAKAETAEAAAAAEPQAGKAKGKKAPASIETLQALIADIAARNNPAHHAQLVEDLCELSGAKINDKVSFVEVTLAGLTVTSTAGAHNALVNWTNKARRVMLDMTA